MWDYNDIIIEKIQDFPEGAFGFIYLIQNLTNGKYYIGKKSLYSERKKYLTKKEIALLENKRLKKWKLVKTESDWLTYYGSNKALLEDIKNSNVIKRSILKICFSKTQLTYEEVKHLFLHKVLEDEMSYNDNINGCWFKGNIT